MKGAEYAELAAFVAVAEESSFRRAAARLGVTPSALSHTLRGLEGRLGTRLLHRTTRSVSLTDAGAALLQRVAPALADVREAVVQAGAFRDRPAGTVRVNLPRLAAQLVLAPLMADFVRTHPDVRLELVVDDGLVDIVAAGCDAGIRPGELLQQDMVAVRLTPDLRTAIVASPAYLQAHGAPTTPADLAAHACINYRFSHSGALHRWPFERRGQRLDASVDGPLVFNDVDLLVEAAAAGAGLACTLEGRVQPLIDQGRLVRVLADWCAPFPGFFLYHAARRQTPTALRALIDFLRAKVPASAPTPASADAKPRRSPAPAAPRASRRRA